MAKQKLTINEVMHVAKLARLPLTQAELAKFLPQLSETLDYVEQLNKITLKTVEPTSQVTGIENSFREDEVNTSLTQEQALQNAPKKHNGFVVVNFVFENS